MLVEIPNRCVILLSGIPATGKSTFACHLAREHGFAHYDLECYPRGWPRPELIATWNNNRSAFVAQLRQHHDRVALDWGFPVSFLPWVQELLGNGVQLIWFDGDIDRARQAFVQRGGITVATFDQQVAAIQNAGYPASLDCVVVRGLSTGGVFLDAQHFAGLIFP